MIRVKGRYRGQMLELDQPLDLPEGAEVVVEIRPATGDATSDEEAWREVGMSRLEEEWDNPQDAVYDDWERL
jgi:predicted DNA-binding antitoxin AbrB/MazE fold protein